MAEHLAVRTTSLRSDLIDPAWWRAVIERVGRQNAQLVMTLFAVAGVSAQQFDFQGALLTLAGASVVTILKAVAGVRAKLAAPWYWQVFDRTWPAAAGGALGLLGAESVDLLTVNWGTVGWVSLTSAVVAAVSYWATPPGVSASTDEV